MTDAACYINHEWRAGRGSVLTSTNPCDGATVWEAPQATPDDVADAVAAARQAQPAWEAVPVATRRAIIERFATLVDAESHALARVIAAETGKPLWEAKTEAASVVGKAQLSIGAYDDRTPTTSVSATASLTYRPLGVVAVLGPFNFPAHLPNGQILPALLAGNTVVYKPSELTPAVAAFHVRLLTEAGVPAGVINLVIGGRDTGEALVASTINVVAFTGSVATGRALHRALAERPDVLLALEMGGNNPLVVANTDDIDATVNVIIRSAFITAGQRCTCARRLYLPTGEAGDEILDRLVEVTDRLLIGSPIDEVEPFAGPVISAAAADHVRRHIAHLVESGGSLLTRVDGSMGGAFVRPTIVDCTGIAVADVEVFGPVLTVHRFDSLDDAFAAAADTQYGLAAGFIGTNQADFDRFQHTMRAGIVNWNTPTTGASGQLPFGGVGASGNHRPAGWAAADFCAYPVATLATPTVADSASPLPGLAAIDPGSAS